MQQIFMVFGGCLETKFVGYERCKIVEADSNAEWLVALN